MIASLFLNQHYRCHHCLMSRTSSSIPSLSATRQLPTVCSHIPKPTRSRPRYGHILAEVCNFFRRRKSLLSPRLHFFFLLESFIFLMWWWHVFCIVFIILSDELYCPLNAIEAPRRRRKKEATRLASQ